MQKKFFFGKYNIFFQFSKKNDEFSYFMELIGINEKSFDVNQSYFFKACFLPRYINYNK